MSHMELLGGDAGYDNHCSHIKETLGNVACSEELVENRGHAPSLVPWAILPSFLEVDFLWLPIFSPTMTVLNLYHIFPNYLKWFVMMAQPFSFLHMISIFERCKSLPVQHRTHQIY